MASIPITNIDELQAVDFSVNLEYHLANDIDASDTINWNGGEGFAMIGGGIVGSVFDGQRYAINDLYINRPSESWVGLFDYTPLVVRDVIMNHPIITGSSHVGTLSGAGVGTISNCESYNVTVHAATENAGGLIGHGRDYGIEVPVISKCVSTGAVSGGINIGGLVGCLHNGSISESHSTANVLNDAWENGGHGGLVGCNGGTIENCYACGTVTAYNTVTPIETGGFVGSNVGTITKCYSVGSVSPPETIVTTCTGGFAGQSTPAMIDCYWDVETSGHTDGTSPDAIPPYGKTTAQMKQQATFVDWDFDTVWKIVEGFAYPIFQYMPDVFVTPASRIVIIPAENRTEQISAEDRTAGIQIEDRTIIIS